MNVKSLLLAGFAAVSLAASADVELKNAVIVHPDKMKGWEPNAVDHMKTSLEKMTGKTYRIFPERKAPASGVKIYIGNTRAARAAGIDPAEMESQQFRMKAGNGKVFLIGGTPTGTYYAVSTFLQNQFGVYWLAGDCQVYPKNAEPKVKDQDKTQKPDITDRKVFSFLDRIFVPDVQKKWHEFHRINRMFWATEDRISPNILFSPALRNCHSFYRLVPPKKYFKDHPEYYSMRWNGQRAWKGRGNLCLSNREIRDVMLKELLALIRTERKKSPKTPPSVYTVAPEDGTGPLCHCPECKKRAGEGGTYFALVADLVNYLAKEVRKVYPDIWIATAINGDNDSPDAKFTLEKNVIFVHADRSRHSNFMYPLTDPENREGYRYMTEWRRKVPYLGVWDYWFLKYNDQPVVAVDAIIGDCRLFRDLKVIFLMKETEMLFEYQTFLSFHQLQIFLEMQLLFDASQDPEKLINDFMDGYYGAAAPEMKEYLALLRKEQKEKRTQMKDWLLGENRRYAHISLDLLEKSYALVKKGLEKVKYDKQLSARVSWELISITHCSLRYYRNVPEKKAEYKQLQEEYRAAVLLNLETLHLKPALEAKVKENLAAEQSTEGVKFSDLPPELASLPAEQVIAIPSKYLKGHPPANSYISADPESSQPNAVVKKPLGKSGKKKLLPLTIGVHCPLTKAKVSSQIKKAPADEKYHWYRIGTISIDAAAIIHADWAAKLMLKDFYTEPSGNGSDPNQYEVWISVRMQGPGYVPGSTRENALYIDRGLLVRKP